MLHLIFQSPIEAAIFERIDPDDVIVFLENAVLRVLQNSSISGRLIQLVNISRLCVLSDDMVMRGITHEELISGLEVISYTELVELAVDNTVVHSWT